MCACVVLSSRHGLLSMSSRTSTACGTARPMVRNCGSASESEERARAAWDRAGGDLCGAELARLIGVSPATGAKYAKMLRNGHASLDELDIVTSGS